MSSLLVGIFESFLGESRKHNEDSGQIAFDCPNCSAEKSMSEGDGKGNLEINYNLGVFHCWSCGDVMRGRLPYLIKKYGTKKNLSDYLLIKPDTDSVLEKKKIIKEVVLPEGYKKLIHCSQKDYNYGKAIGYLRDRGVTDEIISNFNIGYTTIGKYFNRIIIPSYDADMKLNYFISRWFPREYNKIKYLNPEAEKQEIIFNEGVINWDATIYLVEGVFDHIVTPNSIPLLGKYVSPKLFELLYTKASANIVIALDDDAKLNSLQLFKKMNFGDLKNRIKICFPPEGYDPSKIYEKMNNKGIILLLKGARTPTDYELNYLF